VVPLFQRWIPCAFLVCAAVGILVFGWWHGPTILTLWGSHGVDVGDLPAVPLLALALAVAVRGLPVRGGPVPALALGALLFLAGIGAEDMGGPLVPAGGGTFDHLTQRTSAYHSEPVNDWSHIALTYDGQKLRLYLNGKGCRAGTRRARSSGLPPRCGWVAATRTESSSAA
jgi:Concanavalin A-like lectin/glucanases superfamily